MKKFLSILEMLSAIFLIVCFFLEGKQTGISKTVGFEFNVVNAVIAIGAFYVLKTMLILVVEMADPVSSNFLKKFIMFFQILAGFSLIVSGLCDGRDTVIEKFFDVEIIANHGVVVLGVYYASRSLVQLFFEEDGKSIADV